MLKGIKEINDKDIWIWCGKKLDGIAVANCPTRPGFELSQSKFATAFPVDQQSTGLGEGQMTQKMKQMTKKRIKGIGIFENQQIYEGCEINQR